MSNVRRLMTSIWYCPGCKSSLPDGESSTLCPRCWADFRPNAAWGPVQNDRGEWSPRTQDGDSRSSVLAAIFQGISRLLIGGLVCFALLTSALLSAIPYGGGGQGLFVLLQFATVGVVFWAAAPVIQAVFLSLSGYRRPSKNKPP